MEFISKKVNFYYDPSRQAYDTAFWHTISGTPAISAGNLVINAASIVGFSDINSGEIALSAVVPTDPTAGDLRQWGTAALNQGAYAYFSIVGEVFSVQVGDGIGNSRTQAVTWDTNWTAAEVEYKIIVDNSGWRFFVDKVEVAFIQQLFSTAIAATTQATADTITDAAHGLIAGQKVVLSAIDTTTGISDKEIYHVINPATNTFQIALTPEGPAVDLLTGDGSCNYQVWPDSFERKVPQSLYIRNSNADNFELEYVNVLNAEVYSFGLTATVNVTADTEFPAAVALGDATANPTTTNVGSMMHGFNGATWDRIKAGITAVTSTLTGWLNTLPWAIYNAVPTVRTEGQGGPLQADQNGNLKVTDTSSSGSAGGGNNTYSTEQGDFTASITDATTNIVLSTDSIGGSAITLANLANAILKVYDLSATEWKTITLDKPTWTSGTKTLAVASCTGAFTFNTGDLVSLTLVGNDKMRDYSADAQKAVEQAPLYTAYIDDSLEDTTNKSAATHYFPSSTGGTMDNYRDLSFSGKLIDADGTLTLTIEGMNDEDTTSGDWVQLYGYDDKNNVIANSWTITNGTLTFAISFNNMNYKYYRVALVASGATNTVIIKQRRKAL